MYFEHFCLLLQVLIFCRMLRINLLIFFFVFGTVTKAATDSSSLIHFNLKSGFPSNNVYSLIQDRNDYLWFATDFGLVKYNGYNINVFNTSNGSLPSDDVFEIYEDRRGRLWLKSFSDKIGYLKQGVFKSIRYSSGARVQRALYFSNAGGLFYFLELWNDNFRLVFVDDDVIKIIPIPMELNTAGSDMEISRVTMTDNLKINLWADDLKFYEWDYKSANNLKYVGNYPSELRDSYAYGFFVSPDNRIFKANMDTDEVYYFDPGHKVYKKFGIKNHGALPGEKLYTYNAEFYPGNFSRNTAIFSNTHVYTLDTNFDFVSRQRFDDIIPTNKQIAYRFADRKGQMWFTTKGDGAWFKPSFYSFYAHRQRIPEIQDAGYLGNILNASFWWDKTKMEMYEVVNNEKVHIVKFKKGIELKSITGTENMAYISTSDGVYYLDRRTNGVANTLDRYVVKGKATRSVADGRDVYRSALSMMHETRNSILIGDTLFALVGNGFVDVLFREDTGFIERHEFDRYSDIFHDVKGQKLYIYSSHKILIRDLLLKTTNELESLFIKRSGINNVKQLLKDELGNIFILGDKHLYIYNERKKLVRKVETDFSASNAIIRLEGGHLYLAGKFGIAFATIAGVDKLGGFSILPNMIADRYNRVEGFVINEDGSGILNTDVDCFSFSLDSLRKYALRSGNTGFFSLVLLKPSESKIHGNDTFKYTQAESLIKLDAINSFGKGSVKYTYRIDEATQWQESGSGEIFLGTLSPGKYHKVECTISDDIWTSKVYSFYIYRQEYWWQTSTWKFIFWATGSLLFLALVFLTFVLTRRFAAKKEEKRRALTELELRAIHSQINPHFIFNTLSTALFFISKGRLDDAYTHVNKFSKLLRAYLKSSQDRYVLLGEEIVMLRNYIELQQVRFEEKFEFDISIDNKLPVNNIQIPALLLQPLVENAINHGLFHSHERGKLSIQFLQGADNTEMLCIIEDDGIGRAAAAKINEESSARESYGTKLTTKLLEVFKQYEHMDITLEYTDKKAPETGTIVTLTLKNLKYIT